MSEENVSLPVAQALASALEKIEAYVPTEYVDNSEPDIDAEHLNHAEQGIMRVTNLLNAAVDVIQGQESRLSDAETKVGTDALTGGMTDLSSGLNKLNSDLALYNNPAITTLTKGSNKIADSEFSAYMVKSSKKTYFCFGFVKVIDTLFADDKIFVAPLNTIPYSSLVFYGATNGVLSPLLYKNGYFVIPNMHQLTTDYYYVSGSFAVK